MNNIYKLSLLVITLIFTQTALADVKIKTRQTMSGQTFEGTTYIKGKRQRSEREMGEMRLVDLTQCDLRRGVQLNPQTKTFIVNSFEAGEAPIQAATANAKTDKVVRSGGGTITSTITVKDTGERKQMFGFTARRLIITMESVSSPDACTPYRSKMQTDGWYIDAEFYLDCQQNYAMRQYQAGKNNGGCQDRYVSKQIGTAKRGYPLYEKMTMFDESGRETYSFVNEVVELSKATLDAALFDVPTDYREVSDAAQMYQTPTAKSDDETGNISMNSAPSTMKLPSQTSKSESPSVGAKKPGTVRIGVSVKTGAVGDGISSADLTAAVQNALGEYLKGTDIEVVPLEAKLAGLIDGEAQKKECDYVLYALATHKKGGGGFGGMFGKVIAPAVGQVGLGHTGSVAGNIAAGVATNAIVSAGQLSANVKSKDEMTLEIRLQQIGGTTTLTRQFKNKAKSDGQDILSPIVEQSAQAIVETVK